VLAGSLCRTHPLIGMSGQSVARNGTCLTICSGRHQLKPVITRGAETMNAIFRQHQAKSA
jgi:riboflavin synthase alpha subunit